MVSSLRQHSASLPDATPDLCSSCREVDLENVKISNLRWELKLGKHVTDLERKEAVQQSSCPLCQMFQDTFNIIQSKEELTSLHLRALSAEQYFMGPQCQPIRSPSDTVLLAISDAGLAEVERRANDENQTTVDGDLQLDNSFGKPNILFKTTITSWTSILDVRILDRRWFDINIARGWQSYCLRNHFAECCEKRGAPPQNLNVLDCETRMIVAAPVGCEYAALSYVWGTSTQDQVPTTRNVSLPTLPKTIEDSIKISKGLFFRYLWIDKYCIDQSNKREKHQQIQQMDRIYSHAELTIIAAAGQDSDCGLPGVSTAGQRSPQRYLRIGNSVIVKMLPHVSDSLLRSKWSSRGWTYQEEVLSNRLLIFTDDQVLYECRCMHCSESMILPLNKMHHFMGGDRGFGWKEKYTFHWRVPDGARAKTSTGSPLDIIDHISEYYQRELSFQEDTLNAMAGIFQLFGKASMKVYNISGIPILPSGWHHAPAGHLKLPPLPESSFMTSLLWFHSKPGVRRAPFPSWSWAGWKGGGFAPRLMSQRSTLSHPQRDVLALELKPFQLVNCNLFVEDSSGSLKSLPQSESELRRPNYSDPTPRGQRDFDIDIIPQNLLLLHFLDSIAYYSSFIHIQALTLSCSVIHIKGSRNLRNKGKVPLALYVVFPLADGQLSCETFHTSKDFGFFHVHNDLIGILLPFSASGTSPEEEKWGLDVLVVEDRGDHYERVGCFSTYSCDPAFRIFPGYATQDDKGSWELADFVAEDSMFRRVDNRHLSRRKMRLG